MALSTTEIVDLSLDLVGWEELPADSAVYVPGEDIETALVGIDIESPELQLAAREGFDLALAHHPTGSTARVELSDVLDRQVEMLADHGVPVDVAEEAVTGLRTEMEYRSHRANYRHSPSIAEFLDLPYMNLHLGPDELGRREMADVVAALPTDTTIAELKQALVEQIPEFQDALTDIETRLGKDTNPMGSVVVHHGAGTNGRADVARAYFEHGVDTVLYIHAYRDDVSALRDSVGDEKNLVVTGHIASDAIGMNRLIDALEQRGIACTPLSGCGLGRE